MAIHSVYPDSTSMYLALILCRHKASCTTYKAILFFFFLILFGSKSWLCVCACFISSNVLAVQKWVECPVVFMQIMFGPYITMKLHKPVIFMALVIAKVKTQSCLNHVSLFINCSWMLICRSMYLDAGKTCKLG